jgi:hypothetical protein
LANTGVSTNSHGIAVGDDRRALGLAALPLFPDEGVDGTMQQVSAEQTYFDQETTTRIIGYTREIERLGTPDEVLSRLDDIVSEKKAISRPWCQPLFRQGR